ncbi:MAG: hypothetical protein ACR2PG_26860 [Hyphomicrobiaceae bacterium]
MSYGKQDRQSGEFLETIEVPLRTPSEQLRCYKISKRFDQDISAVCGCFNVATIDGSVVGARIAFGGMAGIPKRAHNLEERLLGEPWSMSTIERCSDAFDLDFTPLSDMRGSAHYRRLTAQNLLKKYHLETSCGSTATRLVGPNAVSP